jgi:hypothetical protein
VSAVWKASHYEPQVGEPDGSAYIAAAPNASWSKVDPFESYAPADYAMRGTDHAPAHVRFLWMKGLHADDSRLEIFDKTVALFADRHGLLGLFAEAFAAPMLPPRVDQFLWHLAPDAVLDASGKMRDIDPATEGKQRLESFFGPHPRTGEKVVIEPHRLALPHELRFPAVATITMFGLTPPPMAIQHAEVYSWEEVREIFGVRVLLDESVRPLKVSLVATREPILFWDGALKGFPSPPARAEVLNSRLEGITPHGVEDYGVFRASWRCPSLLKAMYLMLYLDQDARNKILKCQAPDCPDWFRVGPKSRRTTYCPPPPGKQQSKCASRTTTRASRARKRRQS